MAYEVLTLNDVLNQDEQSVTAQARELSDVLNRREDDGWSLVHILDQHRQFGTDDPAGVFNGPFFIFHKPTTGTFTKHNRT